MKRLLPLFLALVLSTSADVQNNHDAASQSAAEPAAPAVPDTVKIPPIPPKRLSCGRFFFSTGTYSPTFLVSDRPGVAQRVDRRLVNPWGIALSPDGVIVSDNGTGVGTFYQLDGTPDPPVVKIPAAGITCVPSSITTTLNGTVNASMPIWFNANFTTTGVPSAGATVLFHNATLMINSKKGTFTYPVPNGTIIFSPDAICATTTFSGGQWLTTVPATGSDEILASAFGIQIPVDLKGAKVTWTGTFSPDIAGISIGWKLCSAVYSSNMTELFYNSLGVKPTHTNACSYDNDDNAGTPENDQNFLVAAAGSSGWTAAASPRKNKAANPTGVVYNGTSFFTITKNGNTQPAVDIFVSEDGTISGWNPTLDATHAIVAVQGKCDTVYKGVTLGMADGHNFLYATNFSQGRVDTYDESFNPVNMNGFVDPDIPSGFAPFGIRNIGFGSDQILVTYAKQAPGNREDMPGAGNGYVDLFDTSGNFIQRLISNGNLNSPWGLAIVFQNVPSLAQGEIWVGNFGDGQINVYGLDGQFQRTLTRADGTPFQVDGLWDLLARSEAQSETGPKPVPGVPVYFTAGIGDETHGLFGVLTADTREVDVLPFAILLADPLSGTAPLNVFFDASQSFTVANCGDIQTYSLDFGDGSPAVGQSSPFFSHTYNVAGTYTARLTVTAISGFASANEAKVVVSVSSAPP